LDLIPEIGSKPEGLEKIIEVIHLMIQRRQEMILLLEKDIEQKLINQECPDPRQKEQRTLSINDLYEKTKGLKKKNKKCIQILENPGAYLQKKESNRNVEAFTPIVLDFCSKEHIISQKDLIFIGRSAEGNENVYKKTHHRNYIYFHALVRGGSLVAIKRTLDTEKALSAALIYSKYYNNTLLDQGFVNYTTDVKSTNVRGSFIFQNPKSIHTGIDAFGFYFQENIQSISFSLFPFTEGLSYFCDLGFGAILDPKKSRVEVLTEFIATTLGKNVSRTTERKLESFLPPWSYIKTVYSTH